MSFLIGFSMIAMIAGVFLLPEASVFRRSSLAGRNKEADAQRHCMEEATRLLQSGAPDYKIEVWLCAARDPEAAEQKLRDGLPGYGLAF